MNLIDLFKQLKNAVRLDTGKKADIRGRISQFIEANDAVREGERARLIQQRSSIVNFFLKPIPMPALAIIAIMALLGGGTSFAAEGTLPGDALYPVKINLNENVVAVFQITPEAKANWETALAGRRLEEAARLAAEGRINADNKAELEDAFDTHASKAKKHIGEVEAEGNITAATDASSNFESILRAHKAVFARLSAKSTSSADIENEKSLGSRISDELDDVSKMREDLEDKISSYEGEDDKAKADVKTAAEGKLKAASNVIDLAKSFLDSKESRLNSSSTAEARARLAMAENLVADANAKLNAENYAAAFNGGNQAIRAAQEARLLVSAAVRLNLNVDLEDEDVDLEDEHERNGNSANSSGTTEMKGEGRENNENGIRSSSSVNVKTNDSEDSKSKGEMQL
ncbi:MAG: DUF5667 domain-containing protein [Patescibacteria group bacterium]